MTLPLQPGQHEVMVLEKNDQVYHLKAIWSYGEIPEQIFGLKRNWEHRLMRELPKQFLCLITACVNMSKTP